MRLKESREGQIIIYELSGKIMGGDEVFELCNQIKKHITNNESNIVVDLAEVEWTNSCGLGMLIGTHISASRAGGRLALANVDTIMKLLKMSRLVEILNIYDSREEAVESFLVV